MVLHDRAGMPNREPELKAISRFSSSSTYIPILSVLDVNSTTCVGGVMVSIVAFQAVDPPTFVLAAFVIGKM